MLAAGGVRTVDGGDRVAIDSKRLAGYGVGVVDVPSDKKLSAVSNCPLVEVASSTTTSEIVTILACLAKPAATKFPLVSLTWLACTVTV